MRGGHGGRGAATFRREPFTPRGGPNGGDGGRGGSVELLASTSVPSLHVYTQRLTWAAADGAPGAAARKEGRRGADLVLEVPVGTVALDEETGRVLADLARAGDRAVVAKGGAGGRGNIHFATAARQAPHFAEPGLAGEERWLQLEVKLIADAGLVGPPNAGKSSLLAALTAAQPKVAEYPFTTLDPELGVAVSADGQRIILAEVPGLIAGASGGAGLGLRFLRHLERTRVLVYVVDGAALETWADLDAVRREVAAFSPQLAARPSLVAVNKVDLPAAKELRRRTRRRGVLFVSAASGEGVNELLEAIAALVAATPPPPTAAPAPAVIRLRARARESIEVERRPWGYEVRGAGARRLVERTDFDSAEALERFQVQLDRLGVSQALEEAGATAGDSVRIGDREFEYQP